MASRAPTIRSTLRRAASGLLLLLGIGLQIACSVGRPSVRTELRLGTTISVTTYDPIEDEILDALFGRVQEIERHMSTTERDWETTDLLEAKRAAGERAVVIHEDTYRVVSEGLRYSELSEGAFEIGIGPLVDLWQAAQERAIPPEATEIGRARRAVDWRSVSLRRNGDIWMLFLPEPGMGIDVGGIAKGYAADEAAGLLIAAGIGRALLDFGGTILAIGAKPDGSKWRIGLQDPDGDRGEFVAIIETEAAAIATSGDYERYFEYDDIRYHHIIDPATGYPARSGLRSATVVAPRAIDADALSTLLFVMGLERGYPFVRSMVGIEAIFVTDDKSIVATPGIATGLEIVASDYR